MCLVLYLASVCICCALYLLILSNQVCVCRFAHHVCVSLCWAFVSTCVYLNWFFWEINGLSHFWGVIALWLFTILKMCVHEEYHLVLIYQYYLVSMWYVILMRNSNSIMSISYLLLDYILSLVTIKWIITLWGSNKLCAYYNPRKCEHVRYCHLELILSIILFLCGMLLKQVPIWLYNFVFLDLDLVCEGSSWYSFPLIYSHISLWETDCFKLLFVVDLHDHANIWSYQEHLFI